MAERKVGLSDFKAVAPLEVVLASLVIRAEEFTQHAIDETALATPGRTLNPEGARTRRPRPTAPLDDAR